MRTALLALALVAAAHAEVTVSVDEAGRTIYRRDPSDRAFNARGIGTPPRKMDPHLWFVYDPWILAFCREQGVDPVLAKAVIWQESRFQWRATSRARARGLMQMIDRTGARFGLRENPYDPIANIRAGVAYLAFLQSRYRGNLFKITAAYNAGEGAVDKHGGIPPYKETRAYVPAVLSMYLRIHNGA